MDQIDANSSALELGAQTNPDPDTGILKLSTVFKNIGWIIFGLICLVLFTLLKAPEEKIKNLVVGNIAAQLGRQGIQFNAEKGWVSVGLGLSYVLQDVSLKLPGNVGMDDKPIHIDKIAVSPSVLALLTKRMGGDFWIYNKDGKISGSASFRDSDISFSFSSSNMDIGKLGILPLFTGVKADAILNGSGAVSGNFANPTTLSGELKAELSKIQVDQQPIGFFTVPKINVSKGTLDVVLDKGKMVVKSVVLGKANSSDDLYANASGEVTLARQLEASNLDLKVRFGLSENVHKSFFLIDSFPQSVSKTSDGSYSTHIMGPFYGINAVASP